MALDLDFHLPSCLKIELFLSEITLSLKTMIVQDILQKIIDKMQTSIFQELFALTQFPNP